MSYNVRRYDPEERPPREPAPSRRECVWSCGCFSPEATLVIFLCPTHCTPLGSDPADAAGGGVFNPPPLEAPKWLDE